MQELVKRTGLGHAEPAMSENSRAEPDSGESAEHRTPSREPSGSGPGSGGLMGGGGEPLERVARRLVAGILAEGGKSDRGAARAIQEQIQTGAFSADEAADRLLPRDLEPRQTEWLEARSKSLMRDLVMAPKLRGLSGAGRSVRKAGRNLFAYVLTQLFVLTLFALLFAAVFGVLRYEGVDVQAFVDRGLGAIGLEPGAGADPEEGLGTPSDE